MRLICVILMVAFAASLKSVPRPGPIVANSPRITTTNLVTTPAKWPLAAPQRGNVRLVLTNANGGFPGSNLEPPDQVSNEKPPDETSLAPGVYLTAPYTCIVVVPGVNADDRSVVKLPESDSAMAMIRPELRFIPRGPK